jgi:hypothetical protein
MLIVLLINRKDYVSAFQVNQSRAILRVLSGLPGEKVVNRKSEMLSAGTGKFIRLWQNCRWANVVGPVDEDEARAKARFSSGLR